jgi:hypothetical protein
MLLALSFTGLASAVDPDPCGLVHADVVVDAATSTMSLCAGGALAAQYRVNLGQAGVGKTRQGDQKTPLGRYALSPPRASNSGFTWFVPVGYPTRAQREGGYTGGSIGIHGPPDWLPTWVVAEAFTTPWTDGCIMVATREEIEAVRAWMLAIRPTTIEIVERLPVGFAENGAVGR